MIDRLNVFFTCRSYNVPVVKHSVLYADHILQSYSISAAFYNRTQAVAAALYKRAGEPIQDRLQPRVSVLSPLLNVIFGLIMLPTE